jgi:hypothetical protein
MDKPIALIKDFLGDYADRRRDPRYPCRLAAVVETERGPISCEILSLSVGGLSARCSGAVEKGETVTIRASDHQQSLQCQVEWSGQADQIVRLSFKESPAGSWLESELEELAAQARESRQRRGGVRVKCQIPARLAWGQEQPRDAVILDLGTTGARVECRGEALPETLRLRFGPLGHLPEIVVEVRRIHDAEPDHFGVLFTKFGSGNPRQILDYVNLVFQPRRSSA